MTRVRPLLSLPVSLVKFWDFGGENKTHIPTAVIDHPQPNPFLSGTDLDLIQCKIPKSTFSHDAHLISYHKTYCAPVI